MREFFQVTILISDPNTDALAYKTITVDANLLSGLQTAQMKERQANFHRRVLMATDITYAAVEKWHNNPDEYNEVELQQVPEPATLGDCDKHGKVTFYVRKTGEDDNGQPKFERRCTVCKSEQQRKYAQNRRLRLQKEAEASEEKSA